jgi:rSAM/selenodomain-associated transferase 2/rSAM/selenodomain-associated transferase 1
MRPPPVSAPLVSVVIPVWRDVAGAAVAADSASGGDVEIIGAAAWEDADAVRAQGKAGERVRWLFARRGRGNQMNVGAAAASGEWLLFLHSDSVLPDGWLREIRTASEKGCAAGCFRLGLDAPGWRPRLWEWLVAFRVRHFDLPYGDQGLFVRRDLFEAVGGYSDIPLMEDVEMVRRLRGRTCLYKSASAVLTSARRWERDGWFRRSATNLTILSRYRLGTDVRRLARAYMGTAEAVVGMMARAPSVPGKTRLGRSTEALRRALFLDTWDVVASRAWDAALVFTPSETADECAALVRPAGGTPLLVPQSGDDLGERMSAAWRQLFRAGYARVILIGSDLPSLPPSRLADADRALQRGADLVLGPAEDGGYYLVGLSRPTTSIFTGIAWGGPDVLRQTLARAAAAGLRAATIGAWYDIDSPSDLSRLLGEGGVGARRTKQVLEQGEAPQPSSSTPSRS